MLKIDRQEKIMEILYSKGSLLVTDLSNLFDCSDETIRRDLKELEDMNLLNRTHGGAFISEKHDKSYPSDIREILLPEVKFSIAKEAVKLLNKNDFIFVDSSTTSLQLVKTIIDEGLSITIATNSISILNLCIDRKNEIDVVLLGGVLRKNNLSLTGCEGLNQINYYYADKCFISPPKVSIQYGLTDNNINEANIRKEMIQNSKEKILIADNSKFKDNGNYKISPIENFDMIITESQLNKDWNNYLQEKSIDLITSN